jgi:hypothetical protein
MFMGSWVQRFKDSTFKLQASNFELLTYGSQCTLTIILNGSLPHLNFAITFKSKGLPSSEASRNDLETVRGFDFTNVTEIG